jgi:predicted ester cyclase
MNPININVQVVQTWQEIIDKKDFNSLDLVEAENVENISPTGAVTGIAEHKRMLNSFAKAFPNYKHQNIHVIESGEWIAIEGLFTATHAGDIHMGNVIIEPTYKKINFPYAGFIKVLDGKIAETRLYYDSKLFLRQLGIE